MFLVTVLSYSKGWVADHAVVLGIMCILKDRERVPCRRRVHGYFNAVTAVAVAAAAADNDDYISDGENDDSQKQNAKTGICNVT